MKGKLMGGWKTWIGIGFAVISGGVSAAAPAISDPGTVSMLNTALNTAAFVMTALGIGSKIDKK